MSADRGIPSIRIKGILREGYETPNLRRIVTPNLQAIRRSIATSSIRFSSRSRLSSKVIRVIEDYKKDIAAKKINNLEKRRSLSQLSNNERITISTVVNV